MSPIDAINRQWLDAIPSYVFLVDPDLVIHDYNAAAAALLGSDRGAVLFHRGGDALNCLRSTDHPAGCGHAVQCQSCVVRRTVGAAAARGAVFRQEARLELRAAGGPRMLHTRLTATPIMAGELKLVLLVIEDIGETVELRRLVPMCMYCRKIRDDEQYWADLEAYLRDHLDIAVSHGICPGCLEQKKAEFLADLRPR